MIMTLVVTIIIVSEADTDCVVAVVFVPSFALAAILLVTGLIRAVCSTNISTLANLEVLSQL